MRELTGEVVLAAKFEASGVNERDHKIIPPASVTLTICELSRANSTRNANLCGI